MLNSHFADGNQPRVEKGLNQRVAVWDGTVAPVSAAQPPSSLLSYRPGMCTPYSPGES